ncbi:MoxR family ATPase [uncultured Tessaracoccus sp.]|uniref:AAA family ATPase n=1 Tax=uncultured Tessaracoccus sp. TaxID=905023 RepID=UPI0025E88984|nr:AAA family ATPase [uncultured Tessaracoccus sp.]
MTEPLSAEELAWATDRIQAVTSHFDATVVGQRRLRTALLATLLGEGHILVESVPGLAKTLAASTLAHAFDASFARIQCTPDLLPSDIIGTEVFDPSTASFHTELGPVHANFVLLDEINRSSAKTQAAMLEAMQERQTSIGGTSHPLPDPFVVMATQNPIDEEGTYVLPQAQMDRFLLKEVIDYPSPDDELEVLGRIERGELDEPDPAVASTDDIARLRSATRRVHVEEALKRYVIQVVDVTRHPDDHLPSHTARWIQVGASPRASIAFLRVARAHALLEGRDHVTTDDVLALRHAILRHRIVLTFEALAEHVPVDSIVDAVFDRVPTP